MLCTTIQHHTLYHIPYAKHIYLHTYQWPARYTPQANWGQSLMYQHTAEPYYKGHASFEEIAVSEKYTYMRVYRINLFVLYNVAIYVVQCRVCMRISACVYILSYTVCIVIRYVLCIYT